MLNCEIDDRAMALQLSGLGRRQQQPDAAAVEERQVGHTEQKRKAQHVSIVRYRSIEVAYRQSDLADSRESEWCRRHEVPPFDLQLHVASAGLRIEACRV